MLFASELGRLGGVYVVGRPITGRLIWDGFTVQAFQRVVFQWRPETRAVAFVNVFDRLHELGHDDWLLAHRQTPRHDPTLGDAAARLALLEARPAIKAAYLAAPGDPVQANGLPTSPALDMGNHYALRAQRVVFQEWKEDVPWARKGQVTVALGGSIAQELGVLPRVEPPPPRRAFTIVLDPGHGGAESGAARAAPLLVEKAVALDVALRLGARLRAAGHRVVLTRDEDRQVNVARLDLNGDGQVDLDDDLQARVDVANEVGADLFLSLHANGGPPSLRGLSTYYCAACPGAARHRAFASAVQGAMLEALRPYGAGAFGSGVIDEAGLGKPYGHLFVIGPRTPRVARVNRAPAQALAEMLFVSNARDAALLAQDGVRDLLAAALQRGVESYLRGD